MTRYDHAWGRDWGGYKECELCGASTGTSAVMADCPGRIPPEERCECVACCCPHRPSCRNPYHQAGFENRPRGYREAIADAMEGRPMDPALMSEPWYQEAYERGRKRV